MDSQYDHPYTFDLYTAQVSSSSHSYLVGPQMTSYVPQQYIPQNTQRITPSPSDSSNPAPRLSRPRHHSLFTKQSHLHSPYARLAKGEVNIKRRRIWNHVFEKAIFTPYELSTINAPNRRKVYISSLECHIDYMHNILEGNGHYPVKESEMKQHFGLNRKTAKSMVSGLFHDSSIYKLQLLELARANSDLQRILASFPPEPC
ncbi:hypothetical protein CVT24_003284 [Panaeolus cyanescens]|uniref:Uncharacterized protein n=1 Tax=Panaeolus cyanescens TaxID=181874 RepID=A0A409YRC9_9AGAR|nr:hypothetical protein CVT24_003284 [Panaeolus cyanescens]